jgi:hypothetical protein
VRSRLYSLLPCCAVGVALLSCESAVKPVVGTGIPAALLIQEGQDQSGLVGMELSTPLRVQVLDEQGLPVSGQIVNFRVTSGGGTVFAGASITTDAGVAVERWTLGASVADSQRLEARAIDPNTGQRLVCGVFRATPLPDLPHTIEKIAGDGQTAAVDAALTDSLAVKVTDIYGNPVGGAQVQWVVGEGGGSVSPASGFTNTSGVARTRRMLGTVAGTQTVTATVTPVTPVSFVATATPTAATQLIIVTPASGAAAGSVFAVQPVLRIADTHGNTVPSATAAVTLSASGGASVMGTPTRSPVNGVVTFNDVGLAAPAGSYTLSYGAALSAPATITQPITIAEGTANKFTVTSSGATVVVGSAVTVSAQLADAGNRPVSFAGRIVTWSKTGQGGSFSSATSTTDAAGVATVTFTAGTVAPVAYTISATDNSFLSGSTSVSTIADAAVKVGYLTQPSNAGRLINIGPEVQVSVQDQYGNTVTTATPSFSITIASNPGGATLIGSTNAIAVSGVATFPTLRFDRVGQGYTLRADAGTLPSSTSNAFDVLGSGPILTTALGINDLAIDDTTIFFIEREAGDPAAKRWPGSIKKISVFGGPATVVTSIAQADSLVSRLRVDAGELHWLELYRSDLWYENQTHLRRVSTAGGTSSEVTRIGDTALPYLIVDSYRYFLSTAVYANSNWFRGKFFTLPRGPVVVSGDYKRHAPQSVFAISHGSVEGADADQGVTYYASSTWIGAYPGDAIFRPDTTYIVRKRVTEATGTSSIGSGQSIAIVAGHVVDGLNADVSPDRLLVLGGRVYFLVTKGTTTELASVHISGGPVITHVTGLRQRARSLVTDEVSIYINDDGSLRRYDRATFSPTTIAQDDGVRFFVLDSQSVYWISHNSNGYSIKRADK